MDARCVGRWLTASNAYFPRTILSRSISAMRTAWPSEKGIASLAPLGRCEFVYFVVWWVYGADDLDNDSLEQRGCSRSEARESSGALRFGTGSERPARRRLAILHRSPTARYVTV